MRTISVSTYHASDALGSVDQGLDAAEGEGSWDHAGKVSATGVETVWMEDDIPAGAQINAPWNWTATGFETTHGYTGHQHHPGTALTLALYRAYDADTGRWLSRDPIGEAGGVNLYGYVGDRSIDEIDELGLEPGFGSPGSMCLTDEDKKNLFGYDDEQLAKEREDDRKAKEAVSDLMKDLIAKSIKPASRALKCIKDLLKKWWKDTDPGENIPK